MLSGEVAVLVAGPTGGYGLLRPDGSFAHVPAPELAATVGEVERGHRPRWVWWSAEGAARQVVGAGVHLARAWDVAEAHRLLHGGLEAGPPLAWAGAHGLSAGSVPAPPRGDLFDLVGATDPLPPEELVDPAGHLRADHVRWLADPEHLRPWAEAALGTARRQLAQAQQVSSRLPSTVASESAAALLCLELERDGLPLDRARTEELVAGAAGPRPADVAAEAAARRARDARVLAHVPGRESTDLRNPAQVRELLAAVGVDVPNTRKWVLEPYRDVHPLVGALLDWRRDERIATTYGYRWLEAHVGADDRLRGRWSACDGAAGRMTAENGLHNLPAALRPGVAAHPGHVLVRADLGQVEPRVLAVVSGDAAFAAATAEDDLYAPVAQRLGVQRPVAKVAVLAAMYGQRSGAAGEALRGLEAAYPVAMGLLDRAYAAGRRGEDLRTFGGRLVPTGRFLASRPPGADPALDAARGRFARNAVIQGSAAELFKAWAATVRASVGELGAAVVLCLHDELLLHVPRAAADEAVRRVEVALTDSARRWSAGAPVRFVADTSVLARWSEAKG
ncbi:DNA polymerase I [Phycicoccus endophyticus]|uniref:DNA-directed DNA polymerase n=1 Tax=Phycicoccus endophyticus TaxID=1690220 RepID=A0A7G9R562_9MICO|nr:DNA polymerase [Phycicoccus endophyticus]NHI20661.1 DNA polymerase I [Phycicoccus endophyticus]QNN50737.1 DNA polymerase I [Phycicoccus endophyticus]GGL43528.1 DNA polymerase I [Phycicoccus endophyticus]